MITTQDCDTFVASTMATPAEFARDSLAWSECDDEPCCLDYADEPYDDDELYDVEPSSLWVWVLVIGAWTAGALALAVLVGMAFVAFTPQHPPTPPHSSTVASSTSPDAFIGNRWDGEPAQKT